MSQIIINIPLITHIPKTDNKFAPNKMTKISGNLLYSQSLSRFQRAIVIKNLHNYIAEYLIPYENLNISKIKLLTYKYYTVKNYGSISYRNNKICWKPVKKNYIPNYDLDNINSIWQKSANDSLTISKVITDDNVNVINDVRYNITFVKDITEQKIEIIIDY